MDKSTIALIFSGLAFALAMTAIVAVYLRKVHPPSPTPVRPLKVSLPTFGAPRRTVYRRDLHGMLQCAGRFCGHRSFTEGELFNEIPIPNEGEGAVLGICMPCSQHGIPESLASPKET